MNPLSPKERFLTDIPLADRHRAFVSTVDFERASDAAMLQTQVNLPQYGSPDPVMAAANQHRMEGALLFLGILMTIGDPVKAAPTPPDTGLNFDATRVKS
jgi:hypothetical protein